MIAGPCTDPWILRPANKKYLPDPPSPLNAFRALFSISFHVVKIPEIMPKICPENAEGVGGSEGEKCKTGATGDPE
jgi:hypothetical protein